jgi:hypothetical protein
LAHILFVVHDVVLFITARPVLDPTHRRAEVVSYLSMMEVTGHTA